jgi:molybdenum cofactor sulfurtransferase
VAPETLSLPESALERGFLERFAEYESTRLVDRLRATEYRRFDDLGHTYLDYTGGGVYAESQVRQHL